MALPRNGRPPRAPARPSAGLLVLCGCYTLPSPSERIEEPLVVTAHDPDADFAALQSFFVRPEVRVVADASIEASPTELPPELARAVLAATEAQLLARGYVRAPSAVSADMAVELAYLRTLRSDYECNYYWSNWSYWGYPGYAYQAPYSCEEVEWTSGMLVTAVVQPMSAGSPLEPLQGVAPAGTLQGVWFSGVYGVELSAQQDLVDRTLEGIDQAFEQSPYFTRTP